MMRLKVRDLFTDPSTWTHGAIARTAKGRITHERDPKAVCWCLTGAIYKCYGDYKHGDLLEVDRVFRRIIDLLASRSTSLEPSLETGSWLGLRLSIWNDDPRRTFEEVKEIVEILDL